MGKQGGSWREKLGMGEGGGRDKEVLADRRDYSLKTDQV